MQVEELLDQLCAAAVPHAPALPLLSQATLSLALAQLEFYDSALVTTLADAVKEALAQPPSAAGISSSSSAPAKAPALEELPEGLVSGILLSMAVACSLNRHYDPELLDRLADQVGFSAGDGTVGSGALR